MQEKLEKSIFQNRDHSSITSAKRWVGGVRKCQFLLIYNTIYADVGGGPKKPKTCRRNTWMVPTKLFVVSIFLLYSSTNLAQIWINWVRDMTLWWFWGKNSVVVKQKMSSPIFPVSFPPLIVLEKHNGVRYFMKGHSYFHAS